METDPNEDETATPPFRTAEGVTLLGGGALQAGDLRLALAHAPRLVAADGGAVAALDAGLVPEAVFGDMDSLPPAQAARIPPERLHPIPEQDSTDFDKALRHIAAPFVVAVGFTGRRIDHELAVCHSLIRHAAPRCIVLGCEDVLTHVPERIALDLPVGMRVSLFPMRRVRGRSRGLRWPIGGLAFHPATRIGTSNVVSDPGVTLEFDGPGMLLILPRRALPTLIAALMA